MSLERLPKIIYIEKLVKILSLNDTPLHIAIEEIIQYSQEHHLPLHFTNKVTGAPLGTKLETVATDVIGEELLLIGVKTERKFLSDEEDKLIHSSKVYIDDDGSVLGVNLLEFKYKEEHFINILDGTTKHAALLLRLEDIFCERDDVYEFINTKTKNIRGGTQKNREKLLKIWLKTYAQALSFPKESSYQEIYNKLGLKNKSTLYAKLQEVYPDDFTAKEQGFFKAQKTISFHNGAPDCRTR